MKPFRILTTLAFLGLAAGVAAQQMNYQGRLTNDTGAPLPGPDAALSFSLWDAATGGNKVWGDFALNADLIDGRFSVKLGDASGDDGSGRLLAGAFGGPRFLQIQVGADAPLPRQEVLPAPVALHAVNAEEVLADDGKLTIQSEPSLAGGPSNFQPGGGAPGWLAEFANPGNDHHGGLFLNGDTAAFYNTGTGGLLNLYNENELSDPSPASAKFSVDASGGVRSAGGGDFGGDVVAQGAGSFAGLISVGPTMLSGDTRVDGGSLVVVAKDPDPIDLDEVRRPFEVTGLRFPQRGAEDAANVDRRLMSYQLDNDDNADWTDNSIGVGLVINWGTAFKPNGGSFAMASDRRLKTDVEELEGSLDRLLELRPVSFRFRNEDRHGAKGTQIGFIAQEVEEVFPAWVMDFSNSQPTAPGEEPEPERIKTVGITGFEALAVDALRELRTEKNREIRALETETDRRISLLESENDALRYQLNELRGALQDLAAELGTLQTAE